MEKYPEPPVDTTQAAPAVVDIMRGYFAAKNSHNPEALLRPVSGDKNQLPYLVSSRQLLAAPSSAHPESRYDY